MIDAMRLRLAGPRVQQHFPRPARVEDRLAVTAQDKPGMFGKPPGALFGLGLEAVDVADSVGARGWRFAPVASDNADARWRGVGAAQLVIGGHIDRRQYHSQGQ
jgi:hypothetical protein